MTDEQLRRLLRSLDAPVEPDPGFAESLFAELQATQPHASVWERIVAFFRDSPVVWLAVGSTAASAVLAGAVLGVAINDGREPLVGSPPDSAPPSQTLVPEPTSTLRPPPPATTAAPRPQSTPEPTTPTPTPEPDATAGPGQTAAPGVAPPDESGWGSAGGGASYDINGTWQALPALPDADNWGISDALLLPDGRIAVFRWGPLTEDGDEEAPRILTYTPGADSWESIDVDRPVRFGTEQDLALAADGRIYTVDAILDPSGDRWEVEDFRLVHETDVWVAFSVASGPDGRIYRLADDAPRGRAQLVIYDPATGEFSRSSTVSGAYGYVTEGDDAVYVLGGESIARYHPSTDDWSTWAPSLSSNFVSDRNAATGPDGRLYITTHDWEPRIWAWDADRGTWLTVEAPPAVEGWYPHFVADPDDRLYAIGQHASFVFSPSG